MNKKVPMRTCVMTREKLPKRELIRIVRNKDGEVSVDETGKLNGKGCYLKRDLEVINKARSSKALDRYLECEVNDTIYDEALNLIK